MVDKPGFVEDGYSSWAIVTNYLMQPTRTVSPETMHCAYLVLLPVRFTYAVFIAETAVRSYRTFSPLPVSVPSVLRRGKPFNRLVAP